MSSMASLEVICLIRFHQGYLSIYYFFFFTLQVLCGYIITSGFEFFMGCLCLKMCLSVGPYVFLVFVSSLSLFLFFYLYPTLFYYYSLDDIFVF